MMKLKIYTLLLALSAWSLQSCDNDDDESIKVPVELQNAFSSKYPSVTNVKWESKSGYYVADFRDGYEASAWFTPDGNWHMTETDIPYTALPSLVKTTFETSEYASWKKDDVDKLERQGVETVYVIEVEKQNQEIDLYYSEEGVLIKSVVDTDDEHLPSNQLTAAMEAFINEKYAGARIMEVDVNDRGFTEVDIIHDRISKEVLFDKKGDWNSTSGDIRINQLPEKVRNAASSPQFSGYWIDDAEYCEYAKEVSYYLIELEGNNLPDKKIKITGNGELLS